MSFDFFKPKPSAFRAVQENAVATEELKEVKESVSGTQDVREVLSELKKDSEVSKVEDLEIEEDVPLDLLADHLATQEELEGISAIKDKIA